MIRHIKQINRKDSIPYLKKELDRVFSLWIRNRGANNGHNKCFTCGVYKRITELHCGHYHSRTYLALRWSEENCAPQCPTCNLFKEGNKPAFAEQLQLKYGKDILDKLHIQKRNIFRPSASELKLLINKYKL